MVCDRCRTNSVTYTVCDKCYIRICEWCSSYNPHQGEFHSKNYHDTLCYECDNSCGTCGAYDGIYNCVKCDNKYCGDHIYKNHVYTNITPNSKYFADKNKNENPWIIDNDDNDDLVCEGHAYFCYKCQSYDIYMCTSCGNHICMDHMQEKLNGMKDFPIVGCVDCRRTTILQLIKHFRVKLRLPRPLIRAILYISLLLTL